MCDSALPVPSSTLSNLTAFPLFVVEQHTDIAALTYDVAAWVAKDFHFESSQQPWCVHALITSTSYNGARLCVPGACLSSSQDM